MCQFVTEDQHQMGQINETLIPSIPLLSFLVVLFGIIFPFLSESSIWCRCRRRRCRRRCRRRRCRRRRRCAAKSQTQ